MSLKDKLQEDLKTALRNKDAAKVSTVRLVLSAMNYAQINKGKDYVLTEGDVLGVIAKEAKQRKESIEAFQKGNREDLVAKEKAELQILESYLPKQLSREELVAAAKKVIEEVGAHSPSDKGKVMPKMMAQFKGRAEGRDINSVVSELLGG